MDWNATAYNKFKNERMQPSIDLVSRISGRQLERIIDIGCGSGMSTIPIREVWPKAKIIGVDYSEEMLKKASDSGMDVEWVRRDCSRKINDLGTFDLVFSNAFLQWVGNQEEFLKNTHELLNDRGIIAMQVPSFDGMPIKECIDSVAITYKDAFSDIYTQQCHNENVSTYYDILNRYYSKVEIWETGYYHVMENHEAIIEFIKSTALRPYISRLDEKGTNEFLKSVLEESKKYYKIQENNKVLFQFKRIFFVAEK